MFMVGALGGWFGAHRALKDLDESEGEVVDQRVLALEERIAEVETRYEKVEAEAEMVSDVGESGEVVAEEGLASGSGMDGRMIGGAEGMGMDDVGGDSEIPKKSLDRWAANEQEWFESRYLRGTILFTDQDGRTVEAQLVGVTDANIEIVRSADDRKFQIPLERLVASDREFVEYLLLAGKFEEKKELSPDSIDWESLFNE